MKFTKIALASSDAESWGLKCGITLAAAYVIKATKNPHMNSYCPLDLRAICDLLNVLVDTLYPFLVQTLWTTVASIWPKMIIQITL